MLDLPWVEETSSYVPPIKYYPIAVQDCNGRNFFSSFFSFLIKLQGFERASLMLKNINKHIITTLNSSIEFIFIMYIRILAINCHYRCYIVQCGCDK